LASWTGRSGLTTRVSSARREKRTSPVTPMTQFSYRQKGVCRRRMRLGIGHLVHHLAESRLDFGWDPANQPTLVYSAYTHLAASCATATSAAHVLAVSFVRLPSSRSSSLSELIATLSDQRQQLYSTHSMNALTRSRVQAFT
jgi:hypothetical protein